MRKRIFHCWSAFFCALAAYAQKDSTIVIYDTSPIEIRQIDEEALQKYRGDGAFDYEVTETGPTWWDDFTSWIGNGILRILEAIFGVEKATGVFAGLLELLPYLLIGILIFLLIRFFLKVNARALIQAQKEKKSVTVSEDEHLIKNEDLHQLVQKAVADKNYRLAIRYYYLLVLKVMGEKKLIVWELQKTNDDYIREIRKTEFQQRFRKITRLYDYIWYGDFPIDEPQYYRAEKDFSSLRNKLEANG
ncbi:DUF4129 domain-containing protein [Pricia sp. S334]|uniref:DUF4129 domain-containing protein n=1 Tax=Pricia mediterranea TaxID=3076079 RepID=A0ABU3L9L5_9FLAO|nr:DUF4129 domain-containing protein [Pricia sp. S334]MDT7829996.1 DUF4129 domain-containing protein [Pricia sp. S334]